MPEAPDPTRAAEAQRDKAAQLIGDIEALEECPGWQRYFRPKLETLAKNLETSLVAGPPPTNGEGRGESAETIESIRYQRRMIRLIRDLLAAPREDKAAQTRVLRPPQS